MSQILSYLYVGDAPQAKKEKELYKLGITHVLNMAADMPEMHKDKFQYKHIEAIDKEYYDISQHFEETNEFIHQAAQNKGVVYVHCACGISRAPITAMAYLIGKLKYSYAKAKHFVEKRRTETFPNLGFLKQLEEYANKIQQQNQIPQQKQKQEQLKPSQNNYQQDLEKDLQQKLQISDNLNNQQKQQQQKINKLEQQINQQQQQQQQLQAQKEIQYRCKNCRTTLFIESEITHQKKDPFKDKCSSIFIEQPQWIDQEQLYDNISRLNCPKCKSKLGEIHLSGKTCSCGQWIAPAFQCQLKQIDVVKSIQNSIQTSSNILPKNI